MEDVLEVYCRPYDPRFPVVNMDEQPVQLLEHANDPIPMQPGRPACEDYEYKRNGTACIFLFTEALRGWRRVSVSKQRRKIEWAHEMRILLEQDYPDAEKIILICDNLNTHVPASFYEAFAPEVARSLLARLEIHYTPIHGSWLNIAECELSAMTRQCLSERVSSIEGLSERTQTWADERNAAQKGVDWRFSTDQARMKLKHLYPQIQL